MNKDNTLGYIENIVCSNPCVTGDTVILTDDGYKTVTLSTSILAENETSEYLVSSILTCFKESEQLLDNWQSVTMEMFPDNATYFVSSHLQVTCL